MFNSSSSSRSSNNGESDEWNNNLRYVYNAAYLFTEYNSSRFLSTKRVALQEDEFRNEKIRGIFVYKTPLKSNHFKTLFAVPAGFLYTKKLIHMYVVVETRNHWFGLCKSSGGLEIVCGRSLEDVWKSQYQWEDDVTQEARNRASLGSGWTRPEEVLRCSGGELQVSQFEEIVSWIFDTDQTTRGYNFMTDNCKDFSKELVERFTSETVSLSWIPFCQ